MDAIPDPPAVAALYSQLASVLAGFAFAGVVALVAAQLTSSHTARRTLESGSPLVAAFIALVISSINFAFLAGERPGSSRAAVLQTLASMGLSVACAVLFYSILILVRGLQHDAPSSAATSAFTYSLIRDFLLFLVSPICVLLMWNGAHDHINLKYGATDGGFRGLDWIALSTLVVVLVVAFGCRFWVGRRRRFQVDLTGHVSYAAAGLAAGSIIGCTLVITFIRGDARITDAIPGAAIVCVGAFVAVLAFAAVSSAGSDGISRAG